MEEEVAAVEVDEVVYYTGPNKKGSVIGREQ